MLGWGANVSQTNIEMVKTGDSCGVIMPRSAARVDTSPSQRLNSVTWTGGFEIDGNGSPASGTKPSAVFRTGNSVCVYKELDNGNQLWHNAACGEWEEGSSYQYDPSWS